MKLSYLKSLLFASMATLALGACSDDVIEPEQVDEVSVLEVSADGATSFNVDGLPTVFQNTEDLTADEIEFLFAVREDEKVPKDLYSVFYTTFGSQTFSKISLSEATHVSAVEAILDFYEIEYPALEGPGVFADADRQAFYNDLLSKGTSAVEAFKVMAYLEESNIYYYSLILEEITNPNIDLVITNLSDASENHLRAAVRQITALGGTYFPILITQEDYDAIVSKPFQGGSKYRIKGSGILSNAGNVMKGNMFTRGAVNQLGICTFASSGSVPGTKTQEGTIGKSYRWGIKPGY